MGAEHEANSAQALALQQSVPEAPQLPPIPGQVPEPAFKIELMPEVQKKGIEDWPAVMESVFNDYRHTFDWLKKIRQPKEEDWGKCRAYYDQAQELALDSNRRKSVQMLDVYRPNAELSPERMAVVLPIIYESVKLIGAHLFTRMRGTGQNYCELVGREKNDIEGAKRNEEFLNYQYGHEIPTSAILKDHIDDALIIGTGVRMQTWDKERNVRKEVTLDRSDVWWDNAPTIQESRVVVVRREVSVGELKRARDANPLNPTFWFSDEDISEAASKKLDHRRPTGSLTSENTAVNTARESASSDSQLNENYKKVWVDVMMHTEPVPRWVYVVNETLVIGVGDPVVPDVPEMSIEHRFPLTVFSPVRKTREIDGDSIVLRMLDSQDMACAVLALLTENLKSSTLGVGITDDEELAGNELIAGQWHFTKNGASGTNILHPTVNAAELLSVIDWFTSRTTDQISGATSEFSGKAQYSGMPATAIRDLMGQSATRMTPMEDGAMDAQKDSFSLALTLNRLYLEPHKFFYVIGEQGQSNGQRGIDGGDLIALSGADIVPTGLPGGMADIAQKALNYAGVLIQNGRDPSALLKFAIERDFQGYINIDDIFPENGVGNDPMQEAMLIAQGQSVSRDPDDNDIHHYQQHIMDYESKPFQQMAQQNPMILLVMEQHIQVHIAELDQMAAMMGGAPKTQGFGSGTGTSGLSTNLVTKATRRV